MRRIHIPLLLLLALYLVGHFRSGLRAPLSGLASVTQAQGYPTGIHYAPAENLERLDADVCGKRGARLISACTPSPIAPIGGHLTRSRPPRSQSENLSRWRAVRRGAALEGRMGFNHQSLAGANATSRSG